MIALENILSQEIIQKLGWTLLHFIWQAAVLAIFLAILLRILRKSTANLRYIIASLTLALIVLLPAITIQLVPVSAIRSTAFQAVNTGRMPVPPPAVEMSAPETIVIAEPSRPKSADVVPAIPFKQRAVETLEPALPHIVSGWLIGVLALSLWHLGGWTQLQRLKRRMVKPVDNALHSKLKVLAQRLRVKQTVQLMESALVQIPTVVGWLRPVILLPASALTGLSPEQLKAILAHELAHIKRYDYLINMLQTIVEILGFYHPAVWWVSHKIRAERENCCDDLAVSISGDRLCYARALTSMEEIRTGRGHLAVAAGGGNLFKRIYRLLGKDKTEKTGFSWIPAASAILLIIALAIPTTLALAIKAESQEGQKPVEPQLIKLNTLPDVWKMNYFSGSWPTGMARDLVQLKAVPTPAYEYDESWKEERLEFRIRSLKDERIGSILFWGERRQIDYITLSPGKYLLSYTRDRTDPKTSCLIKMNRVEFPLDLSRRGMYTLVFSPKLEPPKTTDNKPLPTTCTGRVVDIKGNPLTSAQVASYELYFDMAGNLKLRLIGETVTKADGNFLFETTPSVRKNRSLGAEVVARKEGLAVGWALWPLYGNQKATITLQEPAKFSGKVVDENGSSIPNANIRAVLFKKKTSREEKTMWLAGLQPFNWLSVHTDRDGRFEFNNIPENSAGDLLVTASGFGTIYTRKPDRIDKGYELAEFVAGQTDIKITMPIEARIEGKVVNKRTGAGIPGVTLRVIPHFTPVFFERYLCTTKEDGTFNIGGLRSGKYMIRRVVARTPTIDVVAESGKTTRNVILKIPYEVRNPKPAESGITTPNENDQHIDSQDEAKRIFSANKLKWLGLAVAMYAEDHDENLPQNLQQLKPYLQNEQDFDWLLDNAEYFGSGKTAQRNAAFIPIAYDKSLFIETDATNVLFLDFSVRFLEAEQLEKLNIKRAEFLIDARFLAVGEDFIRSIGRDADSPEKAQALLRLKSELLEASDSSKTQSVILDDLKVSLLLGAARASKDSGVLAAPQVLTREGKTAEIGFHNNETYYISGYSEPNRPSDKPQPKIDKVEEGISLTVKPRLTPNKNIDIEFELEITQVPGFEEHKYEGKYPYKLPSVQKSTQATRYIARNGQTLLFGGHKIADKQDAQTEQKDLLILIKAETVGSPVQAKDLILAEPGKTTGDVIVQPGIVQSRIVEPTENEQEKTKSATEQKPQIIQKFYKLEYYSPSQMAQIIKPLLGPAGYISTDESKGYLLVIDTVESLLRIEKIITDFDVPEADKTVTEIFEIRHGDPVEIVKSLKMLIGGQPGFGAIIGPGKQPVVLIPEPKRNWIIAKASAEDMKRIREWIARLDREEPAKKEYEVVVIRYTDVAELADRLNQSIRQIPGLESQADILLQPFEQARMIILFGSADKRQMVKKLIAEIDIPSGEFETRVFKLKYSDPNQIKENIDSLYGGTAPGGRARYYYRRRRDSQLGEADTVKVISYPELKQVTVIASPENMLKIVEQIKEWDVPLDVEKLKPRIIELHNSDAAQMAELLRTLFTEEEGRGLNIYNILFGSRAAEKQKMAEPLYGQLTFEEVPGTNKIIVISKIPEAYDVVEEFICDLDSQKMTPEELKQISEQIKKLDREEPPLITKTFIDAELPEALNDIGSMAGIPIIPDEKVVGLVTAELKDVPLE
jgi:type II secretory pathway component GspD/PulD (secretin)/beta-lactamase regulating signal transducer with metallopeptidase domain